MVLHTRRLASVIYSHFIHGSTASADQESCSEGAAHQHPLTRSMPTLYPAHSSRFSIWLAKPEPLALLIKKARCWAAAPAAPAEADGIAAAATARARSNASSGRTREEVDIMAKSTSQRWSGQQEHHDELHMDECHIQSCTMRKHVSTGYMIKVISY